MARISTASKVTARRTAISRPLPEGVWGYILIAPWLVGFLGLTLWPMLQSLYLSFTDYDLLSSPKWVGMANYKDIFFDSGDFRTSIKVTFLYVALGVPLKLTFALMVALLLSRAVWGMPLFRAIFYLPSLIGGSVAIAMVWRDIFGNNGIFNRMLAAFGIRGMDWINDPGTSLYTLVLLAVWQFGSSMVIFLAGLKQIPRELYEAASVDGASRLRTFFNLTIPMLTPLILFNLVMQTIYSFQMFTQAYVITNGGPMNSTLVYALYLFQQAFSFFDMGYASALAWILLAIVAALTGLIFWSSRKWVHYES
ncbi:carbohydrate ABC transporter permease [Paenibacillus thermoaerophilus]|uniref:Carbohydrate ABC transporter permease n=1 Tax=Paenibacillus thermoaerophilus TaxID=1215385 RepID=A0ABW2V8T5_9BACL|nr:sugar ABC transporter permease [Paenibacillus thermoaerophilus]TMV12027.1 sugar ABC transporter permease [Paenibacillus thermoaerophilus]